MFRKDYKIGSEVIDIEFQRLLTKRLTPLEEELRRYNLTIGKVVTEMTANRFQRIKCLFGQEWFMDRFWLPTLPGDLNSKEARIDEGRVEMTT